MARPPLNTSQTRQAQRRAALSAQADAPRRRLAPPRFRLLPITMMMLVLFLGVKINALYLNGTQLYQELNLDAVAAASETTEEEKAENKAEETDKPAAKEEAEPADAVNADADEEKAAETEKADKKDEKAADEVELASLDDPKKLIEKDKDRQFSQIELDILQNLAKRREELEKQAADLDMKEKLLDATELRVNDKLSEMKSLQTQVEKLLKDYQVQEDSKLQGLVKIYESMKPKDASTIFNELDMGILLEVTDRMSERKVAPILAGMDPMRAKELTEELAEYRKLQAVPKTLGDAQ